MDTADISVIYSFASLILAFLIAEFGKARKIGYWSTFFISLVLSPLAGLLFVGMSDKKVTESHPYKDSVEQLKKE